MVNMTGFSNERELSYFNSTVNTKKTDFLKLQSKDYMRASDKPFRTDQEIPKGKSEIEFLEKYLFISNYVICKKIKKLFYLINVTVPFFLNLFPVGVS